MIKFNYDMISLLCPLYHDEVSKAALFKWTDHIGRWRRRWRWVYEAKSRRRKRWRWMEASFRQHSGIWILMRSFQKRRYLKAVVRQHWKFYVKRCYHLYQNPIWVQYQTRATKMHNQRSRNCIKAKRSYEIRADNGEKQRWCFCISYYCNASCLREALILKDQSPTKWIKETQTQTKNNTNS